jgi:xanthine dehydrogenase accessory factor
MKRTVLQAVVDSIEARVAVALVSVTAATGGWAEQQGRHLALWLDESRLPVGDLVLGDLAEPVLADVRSALRDRKHRQLSYTTDAGLLKLFVEVEAQPPHLIIVGAGHIAAPLAAIAKINDFAVTVLDDRPQYANRTRFPTADQVIAGPFRAELQGLRGGRTTFDNHTYLVLVTRGHQYDIEALLEVLDDPVAYIGMIGSQRRIRAVFELLEKEQGIPASKFDRIYAPIGLDIGAQTPAEIAVCIMAEIINVLRQGPAVSLSEQIRRERQLRRERARQ